jgi:putative transposase
MTWTATPRLWASTNALARIADWKALLESALSEEQLKDQRGHSRTGRPLGDETFMERLESAVGRTLKPQKRGPKTKQKN